MSFEFVIPLHQSDLLRAAGTNQYVVEDLCASRQIADKVFGCKSLLRNEGPFMLLENFDIFYSVLRQFKDINSEIKEMAWELLIAMCKQQTQNVASYLEDDLDSMSSHRHLNFLKMNMYLLSQMAEAFETEATRPSTSIASSNRGGRKKPTTFGFDWENEREHFINIISQPIHLDIYRLWDPPVTEEEFVNLVANCCYKLLENPLTCRNKTSKDAIFNLIGVLVKRYNHTLSASLKVTQLLQHFEHLSGPLAEAVSFISTNFGVKNIVNEILREIGSMDPKDLARDNSGTRSYAAFLVELAERIPAIMLPSISVLLCHLDGESYTMRNSMLGVIGEIVLQVLSGDTLDAKAKATRDQLLDKLEDHIHDVNAFTRSKALQIWNRMCNERAIPLTRQRELLPLVIGRLQDKSSVVRKSAVQLLTALMVSNPFAAKLSVKELQDSLDKESKKLDEMMPEEGIPDILGPVNTVDDWETIETEVIKAIQESAEDSEDMEKVEIPENKDINSIVVEIRRLLEASEFDSALNLLNAAKEAWSNHEMFNNAPPTDEDIAMETNNMDSDAEKICALLKSIFLGFPPKATTSVDLLAATDPQALIDASEGDSSQTSVVNELTKQQILVQYFKDCVAFASQLQEAVPIICLQLGSKATTDVMEAIAFFVTAFEFGISNSMQGVRSMMALVWSKDQNVKDAVVAAYQRLYLTPKGGNARSRSMAIVNNLTALTIGATIGELTSLEELMVQFVKSNDISKQVVQLLWERFTMKLQATTEEESRGAIIILGMAAGADVDIVRSNVDVLVGTGLGPRAETDFMLARYTCSALLKLGGSGKPKVMNCEEPFRFPSSHDIFSRLADILSQGIDNLTDSYWQPFADQAVNTIYRLSEHPDTVCGNILKKLATNMMLAGEGSAKEQDDESPKGTCPAPVLSRFLGFSGQVALQQLVHLDVMVTSELKRRHYVQEKTNGNENRNKAKNASESNDPGAIEDELGLTGATAEDAESEYIRKICETECVTGPNLLSAVRPLLIAVCSNPSKYKDSSLRASACLALAKFMLVSSEFCDAHLQLLFTVLEKSPEAVIRANTIIAIGDLTFRFPNLIEPWTANLYARLRDESVHVRKNTLMVLTHLILNDMVKVKGQISEMATCMVDTEPRIAALAKLFFFELSKKGNAVYNVMPDMISRLSDPDCCLPEDDFRTIMKYLFTFIQKERQSESLVEKLCHRFRATRTPEQVRDLSYCLAMLSYSEKSIKRLVENFACFSDKLADIEVFNCFQTILTKAKKLTKPELKVFIEDFEERITTCHTKGVEDDEVVAKATKAASKVKKGGSQNQSRPTPTQAATSQRRTAKSTVKRSTRRGRRRQQKDDDSEDDEGTMPLRETAADPANCNQGRSVRKAKGRRPKGVILSSDEDSDEEEVFQSMLTKAPTFGLDENTGSETENSAPNSGLTTASGHRKGKRKLLSTPDGARGASSRLK